MRSILTIHKAAVEANLKAIKTRLNKGVKTMAVVKSNAYGHGLVEFATCIKDKTDWFCVVRVEEGVLLRENRIQNPILVFEIPTAERAPLYTQYNLTATIADISGFGILEDGTEYHLNFETGMKRLGFDASETSSVLEKISSHSNIKCTGIYTHYANSDSNFDITVATQLARFNAIRAQFPSELMTHTANSGAILYHTDKDLQFDGVRPGISLYGYAPGLVEIPDLRSVIDWTSYIMQLQKISLGEAVSYGSAWKASEKGWIATVPVGYSDGIPRVLGGNMEVMANGEIFKQVGRVTMDYIMFFTKQPLTVGTEVYLLNKEELTPEVWAEKTGTISYEIITGINARTPKRYV